MTSDEDSRRATPRKPGLPVWQGIMVAVGMVIAFGGLGWEILHYRHVDDYVPRALVAVIIGGVVLMAIPIVIKVPAMIRMWRRL